MVKCTLLLIVIFLFVQFGHEDAHAGTVTGNILKSGSDETIGEGHVITIRKGGKTLATTKTDKNGDFSVYVRQTGACQLSVKFGGNTYRILITSKKSKNHYKLELCEPKSGNRYVLKKVRESK